MDHLRVQVEEDARLGPLWIVADGTGADAVLRLLEDSSEVDGAILLAPCDEYFAGERHGRPYHWGWIRRKHSGLESRRTELIQYYREGGDGRVDEEESKVVAKYMTESRVFPHHSESWSDRLEFPEIWNDLRRWTSA